MSYISILDLVLVLFFYVVICCLGRKKCIPIKWPIVGMFPDAIANAGNIFRLATKLLAKHQLTFHYKGPWFVNSDMLVTVDPANVHYIMSSNFTNFPKGSEFNKIFDVLGDAIFNVDGELWKNQRKLALFFINHNSFHKFLEKSIHDKLENGVIPLFDQIADKRLIVDLQDVFTRITFDITCKFITGYDPASVSIEFPEVTFSKALDDAEHAIFYRHVFPEFVWKFQRWIGIGVEKKMSKACEDLNRIAANYIKMKREELARTDTQMSKEHNEVEENTGVDLLTSYMTNEVVKKHGLEGNDEKFLRDTIVTFMIAGRDAISSALTWFFWAVSMHPSIETKIREEVISVFSKLETKSYQKSVLDKLVYLHGALCETLRLYPPVPFQHKRPLKPDVLPSGHKVHPKLRILIFLHAMGRMKAIWGEDCFEFKPERWITDSGRIRHEPSYKFLAFNAGPRTCVGREAAFIQMKSVVAAIISHGFHVEVDKGHQVIPSLSVILQMKYGLKARIKRKHNF